jgi:glycosyltransferase involved in cell wall biosynthesis
MMRVAIIHEWLEKYAGAERILEQLLEVYPKAELFCLVDFLPEDQRAFLQGRKPHTSFIQKLPFARENFRSYLPLFPMACEEFDLSSFDVVISNSYAFGKGVLIGPQQLHISICCSPIRYAWDLRHQYLQEAGIAKGLKSFLARAILNKIRLWDAATAQSVDEYVAISHFVASRIKKCYGRSSVVLYPPVDTVGYTLQEPKEEYYFTASRLVPYKKVALIVDAFKRMPRRKLVVIGDGPEASKIAKLAADSPNIQLLGYQPFSVMKEHMQKAKAFVFAALEDFGIVALEAQACGTPVIAFGEGGARETVIDDDVGRTGFFFDEQTPGAIIAAVERFEAESGKIKASDCRANAERFAPEIFRDRVFRFVTNKHEAYKYHREGVALE